jgi:predicted nucleic acid-binding protein
VIAFDTGAARATAKLATDRQRAGRPGEIGDTLIAGIALATGAALATRDTRHPADIQVTLIDPWTA